MLIQDKAFRAAMFETMAQMKEATGCEYTIVITRLEEVGTDHSMEVELASTMTHPTLVEHGLKAALQAVQTREAQRE